jgi:hypothetical protein
MGSRYPSRKQWDWQNEKTGNPIRLERATVRIIEHTNASSGQHTVYTTPQGKRAKLIHSQFIFIQSLSGQVSASIDNEVYDLYPTNASDIKGELMRWDYEIAPEIRNTLKIDKGLARVHRFAYIIVEEDVSSGYLNDVETEEEE